VLAKCGVQVLMSDLFADAGTALLERLNAPAPHLARVGSLRRLIDDLDVEIDVFARLIRLFGIKRGWVFVGMAVGLRRRAGF
jgi:hypothetical protein